MSKILIKRNQLWTWVFIIFLATLLAACSTKFFKERQVSTYTPPTVSEQTLTIGALIRSQFFMVYNHVNSESKDYLHTIGFDYDLITKYARENNLTINFELFDDEQDLLNAAAVNRVQLIIGGLSIPQNLLSHNRLHASVNYFNSKAVLVSTSELKSIPDNPIIALQSSYFTNQSTHSDFATQTSKKSIEHLINGVIKGNYKAAIVDEATAKTLNMLSGNLKITQLNNNAQYQYHWYTSAKNTNLLDKINNFLTTQTKNSYINELNYSFFDQNINIAKYSSTLFMKNMQTKFKEYQPIFKQYSGLVDWRLAMAIGYRESRWNPKAISPWGPSGIMMLTNASAKILGVTNKLDATQSIKAGLQFLNSTHKSFVTDITAEDRDFFTVATYNVGIAKIIDARKYLKDYKLDHNSWVSLVKHLPNMTAASKNFKYGKLKGEPLADYIRGVRTYYFMIINYLQFVDDSLN